jgi:uncharacterized repeat protein (TIGR02543 family)
VPAGLFGLGCPFNFIQVGWYKSLAGQEFLFPKITAQPQDQTVQSGATATFSVSANRATSYQWFKDGAIIPSATASTLDVSTAIGNAQYVARVGNANGQVFSEKARLMVIPAATAPTIVTPPQNRTVTENQTTTFTVLASGTPPLIYQWQRNGSDILGANEQSYATAPLVRANNGDQFRVRVSNGQGSATSSAAALTVNSASPPANADAFEPNDSSGSATPLTLNSGASALISTPTDTDWFRFSVGQQGTLTLALSVPAANDYDLELYGPAGAFLQGSYADSGQTESIAFTVVVTGTYYARVYGFPAGNGSYNAATPYTLACVFTPSGSPPVSYTLNLAGMNGSVAKSPDMASYSLNSLVTLSANANPGYQFTGWSGAAAGNANPLLVTMDSDKTITANFAPLPTGAGSIRVSIDPQAAADAGARWRLTTEVDWHVSGEIVSVPSLGNYNVQFGFVSGWNTPPNASVTLSGSQTEIWITSDPYTQQPIQPLSEFFENIGFADNKFVAVDGRNAIVSTADGVNWNRRITPTGFSGHAFAFGKNLSVIVGANNGAGGVITSSDGTTWTGRFTDTFPGFLRAVTFGQGQFVAVGTRVATSSDGVNWIGGNVTVCGSGGMQGVAYGNGIFAAPTDRGAVLTSNDGLNWQCQAPITPNEPLAGVTFGNGIFVVVGYNGRIFTSVDGGTWAPRVSNSPDYLSGVAFGNNTFVAVGDNGRVVTSPDAVNWTRRSANPSRMLRSVAYGNNTFVAVGFQGTLIPFGNSFPSLITVQPSSTTKIEGEDVTFNVAASGAGPFQFRWQYQGNSIVGETNTTLTLHNISTAQAGYYSVEVSSPSAAQQSQAAALTVNSRPVRPIVSGALLPANAGFELNISGEAGRNYRVQWSTNLTLWIELATVFSTNATTYLRDNASSDLSQRFYRIVTP